MTERPYSNEFLAELVNPDGITNPQVILARKSFWEYCKLRDPKFYKDDRHYLRELCDTLQGIFEGTIINPKTGEPYRQLIMNLPPRHGKSYTLTLFCQWCMGRNNETRIITVSYNDTLAGRFARNVRDAIDETKIDPKRTIFNDVFPSTKIKYGDASTQIWSLDGQFFSYLAAGFGGTITGMGASIGIIDDPIKNNEEAFNEGFLDNQWAWYTDTFMSRVEEGGIQIINMTRWSTKDLCGKLLDSEDADEWLVFKRAACQDEEKGVMLCPQLLSFKVYAKRRKLTSAAIADANYQQEPVNIKGKLYTSFQTYTDIPRDEKGVPLFEYIISYTDTADEGSDFLSSGVAGVYQGKGWMLDVLHTDRPMEDTEPETARQLNDNGVNVAHIESNNGGKGFARAVIRLLWELFHNRAVDVRWFHQGANKHARILAGSSYIMNHLYFPEDWAKRWPQYHADMNSYQRSGKNKHDDGPDMTTGIAEKIQEATGSEMNIWWLRR